MSAQAVDVDELRTLVADVVDVLPESLTDEVRFVEDLEVDSLIALELAVTLQRKYQVQIAEKEMVQVRTFPDICHLLNTKSAQR
ncbi:acyl carrier protein [Amycolatopsis aidingensis]|uniref:acyl carrier protein n=1 Tax=Amycolatopsis aidingensis TaxID=2842453 RepID=UPI001C0B4FEE|nr:acyl carrier protein [Amycolatopsis aidingensis]